MVMISVASQHTHVEGHGYVWRSVTQKKKSVQCDCMTLVKDLDQLCQYVELQLGVFRSVSAMYS